MVHRRSRRTHVGAAPRLGVHQNAVTILSSPRRRDPERRSRRFSAPSTSCSRMVCAETCVTKYASSTSHRSRSRDRRRTRAVLETERSCRHRVVRPNVAPPLWGRLPARARPRDQCAAVARPVSRVPAARSARRDPRRALRIRNVERAVRVAGRGDEAARGAALCGGCSLLAIGTSDPLNLAGIVTPGERVRSAGRNRMVYRDGIPLAVMEGDFLRELSPLDPATASELARALTRRRLPSLLRT